MSNDDMKKRRQRIRALAETGHVQAVAYRDDVDSLQVYFKERTADGEFELFACVFTSSQDFDRDPEVQFVDDVAALNEDTLAEAIGLWLRQDGLCATVEARIYVGP